MLYSCSVIILHTLLPCYHAAIVYSGMILLPTLVCILNIIYYHQFSLERHPYIMLFRRKRVMLWGTLLRNLELILQILIRWKFVKILISFRYTVQLRCNFTLTCEQFTHTLEQFTRAHIELLMASVLLPMRNSRKIIRWSLGVASDMITYVNCYWSP